jgi:signal transduction histidine kinase
MGGDLDHPVFSGYPWVFLPMASCSGDPIYLFSYSPKEKIVFYNLRFNSSKAILQELARLEFVQLGINSFAILTAVGLFFAWVRNYKFKSLLYLAQFSCFLGLYGLTRLDLIHLVIPDGNFEFLCEIFLDLSWIFGYLALMRELIKESKFKEFTLLIYYHTLYLAFVIFQYTVYNVHPYDNLKVFGYYLFVCIFITIVNTIRFRKQNPYFKVMIGGFSLSLTLVTVEVLSGLRIITLNFYMGDFAFVIYLFTLIYVTLSNFIDTLNKLERQREMQELQLKAERSASINSMVSHLAHEVNNPLNYISTGEMITRESFLESKNFILGAIPDSEESKSFRSKLVQLFQDMEVGMNQTSKGSLRIKDTIAEIRAITGVDGIHVENFDLVPLLFSNLELTLEKNQVPLQKVKITIQGKTWPEKPNLNFTVLSQKHIFSRSIRTLLNNSIIFALRSKDPKVEIQLAELSRDNKKVIMIYVRNNGPVISKDQVPSLFDLKSKKYFGTEIIGIPLVKDLLKSVQCNISLLDTGIQSGWVEFQIMMNDFQ